jgi:hypothetical protein
MNKNIEDLLTNIREFFYAYGYELQQWEFFAIENEDDLNNPDVKHWFKQSQNTIDRFEKALEDLKYEINKDSNTEALRKTGGVMEDYRKYTAEADHWLPGQSYGSGLWEKEFEEVLDEIETEINR